MTPTAQASYAVESHYYATKNPLKSGFFYACGLARRVSPKEDSIMMQDLASFHEALAKV